MDLTFLFGLGDFSLERVGCEDRARVSHGRVLFLYAGLDEFYFWCHGFGVIFFILFYSLNSVTPFLFKSK